MTNRDKDQVTPDGAVELDEDALAEAQGGVKLDGVSLKRGITLDNGLKWKVNGFDGKGNDVVTEEITFAKKDLKR